MRANEVHLTSRPRGINPPANTLRRSRWPIWGQILVSILLVHHFAALFLGCLALPPTNSLATSVFMMLRPYCDFINQGVAYRYYSRLDMTVDPEQPRPWGTPILLADMEFDRPDGTVERQTLRLPDIDPVWPRLRHQRRLDLAYHLAAEPRLTASYARHLCKSRKCDRVTIYNQLHRIPDRNLLRAANVPLTAAMIDPADGSTYGPRIKLGEFKCTDF